MSLFFLLQTGKKERSNTLNIAIDNMCKKTRDLRRQVRKDRDVETEIPGKMNPTSVAEMFIFCFCSFKINLGHKIRITNTSFPYLHTSTLL